MAVELLPHPPHLFPVMWKWISAAGSSPQKNQTHSQNGPPLLKIYGLENFGTSCYANSILQSLFHSPVFRHAVLSYPDHIYPVFERLPSRKVAPRRILPPGYSLERVPEIKGVVLGVSLAKSYGMEECMFTALRDLYILMSDYSYDSSVICPTRFMEVMGTCNEMFAGPGHQDAHELFISLLDGVMNDIDNHEKTRQDPEPSMYQESISESFASESITMLKDIFSGLMTNETRCLTCENITYRDEAFRDLSLDVDEYPSINERLQNLSETEFLCGKNKFLCDECGGLQEAEKRTKIKKFPKVLVLHLKRFKYCETDQSTSKLFNRMEFDLSFDSSSVLRESKTWQHTPTDVGIATTLDMQDKGIYELFSIVVHLGNSLIQGHYVSITKTDKGWMVFDDDRVEIMQEPFVEKFFGEDLNYGAAYLLFYQEKGVTKIATNGINRSRQTSSVSTSSLHGMSINRTPSSSKVTTATDEPTETFASEQVLTFEVPEQPPREKTSRFKKLRPHASSLSRKFRRKKDQDIVKVEG